MSVNMIISRSIGARVGFLNIFSVRFFASDVKSVKLTQKTDSGVIEYDEIPIFEKVDESEEAINRLRNKSRLNPSDQNKLHDKKPFENSMEWYHDTVRYKRRMLGRYGLRALDVPAGIAWPTVDDVEDMKDYERVAYPISLQESWKQIEEKKRIAEEEIRLRELEIEQKLANMDKWRAELAAKINKKEAEEKAAREKKEKAINEIRRNFGINIDPRSYKFKELLERKQLEDKKKKKALKKEEKAKSLMDRLNKQIAAAEALAVSKEAKKEDPAERKTPNDPESKDAKPI